MPKANFGNTNDGNTSRRFFEDPKVASDITGISYELIYRLSHFRDYLKWPQNRPRKIRSLRKSTAELYVSLYGRHPMTPTMHKILVHGAVIIKKCVITNRAADRRSRRSAQQALPVLSFRLRKEVLKRKL